MNPNNQRGGPEPQRAGPPEPVTLFSPLRVSALKKSDLHENDISGIIVDAAIEVHRALGGPGLLESVYEEALAYELQLRGLNVRRQKPCPIPYKGATLGTPLIIDILVENKVIVECKATVTYNTIFEAQVLTYLRLSGLKLGLGVNFGERRVVDGIHRVVNNL